MSKIKKFLLRFSFLFFIHLVSLGLMAQGSSRELKDFDNYTNDEYAAFLATDGWPIEKLNTAATADYLTDEEKNFVLAHNLVRFDPPKYADLYVYPRLQYFAENLFRFPGKTPLRTREGVEVVRDLYMELKETEPRPLLHPSPGLSAAAKGHADFLKITGQATHDGRGGISARANRHGRWLGGIAENLIWTTTNAHEAVVSLLIDDGVISRGHRINILNSEYQVIGAGIDRHPRLKISYVAKYAIGFSEED